MNYGTVNLSEVLASLWSHKLYLCFTIGLGIFLSGYYITSSDKKFTSKSVFEIAEGNTSNFGISQELGTLASLAGLANTGPTNAEVLLERMLSREFILEANINLNFENDPFFNTYNEIQPEKSFRKTINNLLGQKPKKHNKKLIIEDSIIKSYLNNVEVERTNAGAIALTVTHKKPELAAKYANSLMKQISDLVSYEETLATEKRLVYLSKTLADALEEVETAQQKIKDYALQNSTMAQESFLSGSLMLDSLRVEKRKSQEIISTLSIIKSLIENNSENESSYQNLRSNYPLVDDVEFRRILGMSETISSWTWPSLPTLKAVSITLTDRIQRMNIEIAGLEIDAQAYASSAEELSRLRREAKIAEATYQVIIEQVKSQSLAAGFRPDSFKVFEYATISLKPSSPQKMLLLLLGAIGGLLFGSLLALLNSGRNGVCYTVNSIISESKAILSLSSIKLRRLSRMPVSKINNYLEKKSILVVDQAEIALADKKIIYVTNLGSPATSSGISRILASKSSTSGRKVLLCDTTGRSQETKQPGDPIEVSGLTVDKIHDNFHLLHGFSSQNVLAFFTNKNFKQNMENIISLYDQVYISTERLEAIPGLTALAHFHPEIVLLTKPRKTKRAELKQIKKILPIGILFND